MQTFIIRKNDEAILANATKFLRTLLSRQDTEITIKRHQPKRTDEQHSTFWWWCGFHAKAMRDAGQPCSEEEVHDEVLKSIFGVRKDPWGNEKPARTLTRPNRPSKEEFIEILARFQAWSDEQGIQLPEPVKVMGRKHQDAFTRAAA